MATVLETTSLRPRLWQGWFLPRPLSLASSPLCPHMAFLPCVCVLTSSPHTNPTPVRWEPTLMTLLYFDYLFKGPISSCSYILRWPKLGLQHLSLGGRNSAHNNQINPDRGKRYKISSQYTSKVSKS